MPVSTCAFRLGEDLASSELSRGSLELLLDLEKVRLMIEYGTFRMKEKSMLNFLKRAGRYGTELQTTPKLISIVLD